MVPPGLTVTVCEIVPSPVPLCSAESLWLRLQTGSLPEQDESAVTVPVSVTAAGWGSGEVHAIATARAAAGCTASWPGGTVAIVEEVGFAATNALGLTASVQPCRPPAMAAEKLGSFVNGPADGSGPPSTETVVG